MPCLRARFLHFAMMTANNVRATTREELLIERRRVESMLRMLEGNTHPDDLKRLVRVWLAPVLEKLQELETT
jgi:hypothetical protein